MQATNSCADVFSGEKEKLLRKLGSFRALLSDAREQSITPGLVESFGRSIAKVDSLVSDIESGKLKIALVGAFSDGKTSTVAGLLGHVDASMKIAEEESSDEVVCYAPDNVSDLLPPCEFVDTPGLFGRKFSEITKEYISQAHIILYIVNATNPLKDSHQPMVAWLLETLQKFDNTIFVINRMDDVCDYTDSEDFEEKSRTKANDLRENVARYCGLNSDDEKIHGLNIVCITSNPGNKCLTAEGCSSNNGWLTLERRKEYENYSRMSALRQMLRNVLSRTLAEKLIQNSVLSAVIEESRKCCVQLEKELENLGQAVIPETKRMLDTMMSDIGDAKKDLQQEIRPCREELEALEKKICNNIQIATRETFSSVVDDDLGACGDETGYKLQGKITDILAEHFENIVSSVRDKYDRNLEVYESNVGAAVNKVKSGAQVVGNLAKGVDKTMILAARDILDKLGIVIKFKPWQATKLAGFVSKGVPIIGAGVSVCADVFGMVSEANMEKKLKQAKGELIESIHKTFKNVYDVLNSARSGDATFYASFAPQIIEMEASIADAKSKQKQLEEANTKCCILRRQLENYWGGETSEGRNGEDDHDKTSFIKRLFAARWESKKIN